MHFDLLSPKDTKAIDALIESYGGARAIGDQISTKRGFETRKITAADKGYGEMIEKAEQYAKSFPKVGDFVAAEKLEVTKPSVCTTQVSGFQGAYVTLDCMRRIAENKNVLFPSE
ncbi:MAG: hypothetical protein OEV68_03715, partial [candidate division Zixibacteria bacterium]|nr:hypothetical protein [candidate division Zixibacteria bacterium]